MDRDIALLLVQDGVVNGCLYALMALALVLVFAVTRVVFIPVGEFLSLGALTYAALDAGAVPRSLYLLAGLGAASCVSGLWRRTGGLATLLATTLALPGAIAALAVWAAPLLPGAAARALLTLLIIVPMGPFIYRLAFRPLAGGSVLTLLIAAVGVHLALVSLGLFLFGPEGSRAGGFSAGAVSFAGQSVPGQALWIGAAAAALSAGLAVLFRATLWGAALRATAVNRLGARLVGIAPGLTGNVAFALAAGIAALCGILIAPLTTIYYDSGFLIGLKGFTAAIVAGLASYPGAVAAALLVGLIESFAAFWASALKEVVVFAAIIPVLLWRSWRQGEAAEE